jgi:uncharacterized membrane protein YphA (DoxX/SURF4 family)
MRVREELFLPLMPATTGGGVIRSTWARSESTLPAVDTTRERLRSDPAYQGYLLLRFGFAIAATVVGIDKFFNVLTNWEQYLAPWIGDLVPGSASLTMSVVGVVEIAAGVLVALKPRYGAYLIAAWLAGIIADLLTYPGYYDIALRDVGLMLAALALARLACVFDRPADSEQGGVR